MTFMPGSDGWAGDAVPQARRRRGRTAYLAGAAAEDQVARHYISHGYELAAKRWRGKAGELDLVFRDSTGCIFVEVKKSRDFARAATSLRPRQIARIFGAATEFVATEPAGQLTDMRFDVALLDGQGALKILENALAAA